MQTDSRISTEDKLRKSAPQSANSGIQQGNDEKETVLINLKKVVRLKDEQLLAKRPF